MIRLGMILDELTNKAMTLLKVEGQLENSPLLRQDNLQVQMTAMRLEARQLVKRIHRDVQEMRQGA